MKDLARAAVAREVEGGAAQHEPTKMGLFSGRGGDKGRRVQTPPDAGRPFLPQRPPKAAEEAATWELKAKKVDTLDWRRVRAAIGSVDCNRDAAFDKQLGNDLLNEEERQSVDRRIRVCEEWCSGTTIDEQLSTSFRRKFRCRRFRPNLWRGEAGAAATRRAHPRLGAWT